MTRIAVYGAGGFGREVKGMIDLINPAEMIFAGFLDDHKNDEQLATPGSYDDILFAIADPTIRGKIVTRMNEYNLPGGTLIDRNIQLHPSVTIEKGSIICSGVKFTVDIKVGKFVIINLNATIGHDVTIGDYSSIMPSANISGNVHIGSGVLIGSGATILQGLTIGENARVGAGAVVTKSVQPGKTVIGVPARTM